MTFTSLCDGGKELYSNGRPNNIGASTKISTEIQIVLVDAGDNFRFW